MWARQGLQRVGTTWISDMAHSFRSFPIFLVGKMRNREQMPSSSRQKKTVVFRDGEEGKVTNHF